MEASHLEQWAHRGYSAKYPENTMAAWIGAVECGMDGLECDLRKSRDGHWVVMHDAAVDRTTNGCGQVADLTLAELEALDAGQWWGRAFRGTPIPRLSSVLDYMTAQKASLTLNLEWKSPVRAVADATRVFHRIFKEGLSPRIVHSSFDVDTLACLRRASSTARLALLIEIPVDACLDVATELAVEAVHPDYHMVTTRFVRRCHSLGLVVRPYTVNNAKALAWVETCGVDAVLANGPIR